MRLLIFVCLFFVGCCFFFGDCFGQDLEVDTSGLSQLNYDEFDSVLFTKNTLLASLNINKLDSLSNSMYVQGMYKQSLPYFEELSLRYKNINNKKYAKALGNLANGYYRADQYKNAEDYFKKTLKAKIAFCHDTSITYFVSILNFASLYNDWGKFEESKQLLTEIDTELIKHTYLYFFYLNNFAMLCKKLSQYKQAKLLLEEILTKINPHNQRYVHGATLYNLAQINFSNRNFKEALKNCNKAIYIFKEGNMEKHPEYARMLSGLADIHLNLRQDKKAERLYLIASQLLDKGTLQYVSSLNTLGNFYQSTKDYNKSEKYLLKALNLTKKTQKINQLYYLRISYSIALLNFKKKEYLKSWNWVHKSLMINSGSTIGIEISKSWSDSLFNRDCISTTFMIKILKHIGLLLELNTDPIDQYKKIILADLIIKILNNKVNGFFEDKDKLRMLSTYKKWLNISLNTLSTYNISTHKALTFIEQNKSILLINALKGNRARILGDLPDSLSLKELSLQKQKEQLTSRKYSQETVEDSITILSEENELNLKIEIFLTKLKNNYPKYHAYKYENVTATANEIQDIINPKTLFLEYYVADSAIYLFSLTKDSIQIHKSPITKALLHQKTTLLNQALSDYEFIRNQPKTAREQYTKTAHWFYQNLVAPALDNQKNIKQLIIVPDNCLNHIPFEAFLSQASDTLTKGYKDLHYLLNDYSISYNYSATLLKENIKNAPKQINNKLLACAGHYTHQDSSLLKLRKPYLINQRNKFTQLKSAEQEVDYLQAGFEGHFLTAQNANERSFKAIAQNYGVIHLAMHGRSDTLQPILSSLIFTEDRDSTEDNFLQAYEISRLNLQAQLVVLSACETGYGVFEQGEGVLSLARSFMYAGVPALVVSLWSVDDQSTALLMQLFYQHLADGLPKDQALRQAKLDFLEQADERTLHPFFWASFIQLGHTQSITLDKKGASGIELLLFTAFITLVLSGIFYYHQKYFS